MSAYPKLSDNEYPEHKGRVKVRERDLGLCVKCGRGTVMHWDHRKNRSQGGTFQPSNGQLLCVTCHAYLTDRPHEKVIGGWGVPGWARPDQYPAARWVPNDHGTVRHAWVLYDDNGHWREITEGEAELRMTGEWPGVSIHDERVAG